MADKTFLYIITTSVCVCVYGVCMYVFVTTHQTLHLKCVHFIVCKLYLNKVDFFKRKKKEADSLVTGNFKYNKVHPGTQRTCTYQDSMCLNSSHGNYQL